MLLALVLVAGVLTAQTVKQSLDRASYQKTITKTSAEQVKLETEIPAVQKLSIEEKRALKAKQMEEMYKGKAKPASSFKKKVVQNAEFTTSTTSGKVLSKKDQVLQQQEEINQKLMEQNSSFYARAVEVNGEPIIKLIERKAPHGVSKQ